MPDTQKNTITYKLEELKFDGPLDLLLTLIEKEKIDIYDIPIAEITRQYLECIKQLENTDLDTMSEFLVMAATLLEIKAAMLVPKEEEAEEEQGDPREELVARLIEYRRYKYMAGEMLDMEDAASRYLYKGETLPEEVRQYVPPVDLDALLSDVNAELLLKVFNDVMRRKDYKVDTIRSGFGVIKKERVPLRSCIEKLINYARSNRRFSFRQLLGESRDRTEVVVSFLAVLELMKTGRIEVTQNGVDEDLDVVVKDSIENVEDELDLEELKDE